MATGSGSSAIPDAISPEFDPLIPPDSEFEVRVNDHAGRYMVSRVPLALGSWFLVETPLVCWPLSRQEGDLGLSDLRTPWCEVCLRPLARNHEAKRPRLDEPALRLCEKCRASPLVQFLTQELLVQWRSWQKQKSPDSCVGLEAFGRCVAQVASTAKTAVEAVGLDASSALAAALKPFDRLQGPPPGASVTLHGTSPAEVAAELSSSKEFRSRLEAAVGPENTSVLLREETIEALAGRLVLNAASFTVPSTEETQSIRGAGVYVLLSTMNHSCSPAVRLETSAATGAEVSMLTTRQVEAGEPLTLAYVEPGWPGDERRQQLSSHWFFDCDCQRCEAEGRITAALTRG